MSQPLNLSDRFFGAILGLQTALEMESQNSTSIEVPVPQVSAMLLRYDPLGGGQGELHPVPFSVPLPSVSSSSLWQHGEAWVECMLHDQLRGIDHQNARPLTLNDSLPATLHGAWLSWRRGQSWGMSFNLLKRHYCEAVSSHQARFPDAETSEPEPKTPQCSETSNASDHASPRLTTPQSASVAALGLWIGASQGPQGIPLHQLSPNGMTRAKVYAQQLYWAWSGHHNAGAVEVQELSVS